VNIIKTSLIYLFRIDGKLQFETVLEEETRKKMDRRTLKDRSLDVWKCGLQVYGTELPNEVRNEIFALASSSGKEMDPCLCKCTCHK